MFYILCHNKNFSKEKYTGGDGDSLLYLQCSVFAPKQWETQSATQAALLWGAGVLSGHEARKVCLVGDVGNPAFCI